MTNRRAQRRNETPRFVRKLGPNDVFQVGRALLIIPGLDDAWPPEVKNAVDRRRRANLYGRCDCGARSANLRRDAHGMLHATFEHEDDCPASDDLILELFAKHGITP